MRPNESCARSTSSTTWNAVPALDAGLDPGARRTWPDVRSATRAAATSSRWPHRGRHGHVARMGGVLVVGDYLSAVEEPSAGRWVARSAAYMATLERLRPLVQAAEYVVPGHGPVLDSGGPAVLEEDIAYLSRCATRVRQPSCRRGAAPGRSGQSMRRTRLALWRVTLKRSFRTKRDPSGREPPKREYFAFIRVSQRRTTPTRRQLARGEDRQRPASLRRTYQLTVISATTVPSALVISTSTGKRMRPSSFSFAFSASRSSVKRAVAVISPLASFL